MYYLYLKNGAVIGYAISATYLPNMQEVDFLTFREVLMKHGITIPEVEPEISQSPQTALLETQLQNATVYIASSFAGYTDAQALSVSEIFPRWPNGVNEDGKYPLGQIVRHNERLYRIKQASITPIASQPPDAEGMLAVYSPISQSHSGEESDPIPWAYGMDCFAGKHYVHLGKQYRVAEGGDMIPCVWPPDTAGMWQWVFVR